MVASPAAGGSRRCEQIISSLAGAEMSRRAQRTNRLPRARDYSLETPISRGSVSFWRERKNGDTAPRALGVVLVAAGFLLLTQVPSKTRAITRPRQTRRSGYDDTERGFS